MAIQQANDPANQIDYPHRLALTQFMNGAGNFLLEHWATLITWVLGVIVFAALSVPFLSYFGLDGISKQIFYALHTLCAHMVVLDTDDSADGYRRYNTDVWLARKHLGVARNNGYPFRAG